MRLSDLRTLVLEGREVVQIAREELSPPTAGPVVVSGMLAEQLARQLAVGAVPGTVLIGDGTPADGASVHVHVMAGEPSDADDALVRGADRAGVPVVLVQLWPQEDWTPPFVLSPFVVECKTGEGFPIPVISERIAEAAEDAAALASRVPVLTDAVSAVTTREAVLRAAASARKDESRPQITKEQVRMLARLRSATPEPTTLETKPLVAGAALVLAAGFGLREAARRAHGVLPASIVDPAVAAAGTWVLAKALQAFEARAPSA